MKPWERYAPQQGSGKPWERYSPPQASPTQPDTLGGKIGQAFFNRMQNVQDLKRNPRVDPLVVGPYATGQALGFATDAAGAALGSVTPDFIKQPAMKALGAAAEFAEPVTRPIAEAYGEFKQEAPMAAALLETAGNYAGAFSGAKGTQIVGGPVLNAATKTVTAPVKAAVDASVFTTAKTANLLNNVTDKIADAISKTANRANVPKPLRKLPDAELLFVTTLMDEGVSIDDALQSLSGAKKMGVSPSVSVSAKIPQMQTQGYLMSRGSAGSKVAADAVDDIVKNQIPKMNTELITIASGGGKSAEQYGLDVFKAASESIKKREIALKTRAKPYYQQSIGIDKSIPIEGEFKKVLSNPLAVKALENFRADPYTLTNVQKSLSDLGISAEDISKLPYNSTVALHGARVHLRQLNDAALAGGEAQKSQAIKQALSDIDNAIEATYPSYKTARAIYSEDAGALKALKDSPVGQMAKFSDADYSKIADDLMGKDPQFIKKTIASFKATGANQEKITNSIAGAFLRRKLQESTKQGVRFGDDVFKKEGTGLRLKALIGDEKFAKMEKVNDIITDLLATKNIPSQSITAAAQSVKEGISSLPLDNGGMIDMVRKKLAPSLFDLVQKNPEQAARYNELLFTDAGFDLLEKISTGKKTKFYDIDAVGAFLSKQLKKDKVK